MNPTSDLRVGLGLRAPHYDEVLTTRPDIPWFEVISENFLGIRGGSGGRPLEILEKVRENYPVALHGVSLNLGSADPLRMDYLKRLKALADRIQPERISDHLCWTGVAGRNLHDLLPLPYTPEALSHVAERVRRVQDFMGRRVLLENVSSYVTYRHSRMPEWEFLAEIAARADCGILLDVNNIHVSATNHGFNPLDYLEGLPARRIGQIHLAGYSDIGGFLLDTHDHPVSAAVWKLYGEAVRRFGAVPTMIEWDDRIPAFSALADEAMLAQKIREELLEHQPSACAEPA